MTESTVSAALPQREPGARFKTVGELQRYDWVAAKELDENYAAEILHVEPYGENAAIILFSKPLSTEPLIAALDTSGSMQLASEKEIEEARETRRREAVCARLTQLADLIRDRELPIGERFETIRVSIRLAGMAELDEVANVIGAARESSGPMSTVTWPATPPGLGSSPVEAMWHAYAPSIVADPLGQGFGRNEVAEPVFVTGEVPDYVRGATALGVVHEAEQDRERAVGTAAVPSGLVTHYFSFGHGQTDPDSGESLLDKYVTIVGPSADACRRAMFASRYGNRWAFEYAAGDAESDKWIAQWAEHERIVVDPTADADEAGQ